MTALTIVLAMIALYLWSAPYRQERFYQTATIKQLQAAARREAGNVRLHYVLGQRLMASGRPAEARDTLQKAAEADSQSAEIWVAWATATDQSVSRFLVPRPKK